MRNKLFFRSLLPVLAAVIAAITLGNAYVVNVLANTEVSVKPSDTLSSATATAGQTFKIVAAEPLIVDAWVVVPKGGEGQGHVVSATPAAKDKRGGTLHIQFDWITALGGQHIELAARKSSSSPLVLGAGGPNAAQYPKGKDVSIGPDNTLTAFVAANRNITVNAGL